MLRSGSQAIELVRGGVAASSRSGSIRIVGVAGDVEVQTRSGSVDVQLPGDGNATLAIATHSGAIHSAAAIDRRSWRGHGILRRITGQGGRRVDVYTRSGSVRIR